MDAFTLEGIPQAEVKKAVRSLVERRLLLAVGTPEAHYVAASPDAASDELVHPVAQQARQLRSAADRLRDELTPVYEGGLARRLRRPAVEELHSVSAVRDQLTRLAAQATFEVLTSQPGGARDEDVLQEAMTRTEELLGRGVRMRTLYQHTAQFSATTTSYVEIVSELGAEVRTLGDGFMRMIAFDQEVVVIELRDNPLGALVIREPNIVGFLVATFERMWGQAEEFPTNHGRDQAIFASDKAKEDIIRLLLLGEQDKVIARRMGMTVRTCQRHIAKIMERIGAKSRVHAGYLLREMEGSIPSAVVAPDSSAPGQPDTRG
ncbi:LuxR C-terminal-related transcriptional regulator [Streptomyces sp. NBC_00239]|uniref:LuxR C-terminal-related transcriptional regulator n=1 Tax=Streptomyces sp. NBC_00239 TaxID=2903640 RepID=UPI002E2C18CF|nr:LuxR C-terminal-related transcriptional regulator [Streptomyces sp. NBC_00239]